MECPFSFPATYATFNSDGTYSGSGYFGTGTGTYKAIGKTITCYIGSEVYAKYDVLNLAGKQCELIMYAENPSSGIDCKLEE